MFTVPIEMLTKPGQRVSLPVVVPIEDDGLRMSRAPWIFGGGPGVIVTSLRR